MARMKSARNQNSGRLEATKKATVKTQLGKQIKGQVGSADKVEENGAAQNSNETTLRREVSKIMKELNFSHLGENAAVIETREDVIPDKGSKKDANKFKDSRKKTAEPSNAPNRNRKIVNNQLNTNTMKEKTTIPVHQTKPKHTIFPQTGPETKSKVGNSVGRTKTKFIIDPSPHWYTSASVPSLRDTSCPPPSPDFLTTQQNRAQTLFEADAEKYSASSANTSSTSDARFINQVLSSGTLSDRLSALTLMVQASPSHNTRALDTLKGMTGKKGREESLKALRAVVDWWIGGGAPNRKLKYFRDQPLTHPDVTDAHLSLENLATDSLPYVRTQAMHFIFQLLRDKPEQEQNLLRLLVHKLNDSEKSIASKASYHLLQLLQLHPQMKKIVVQEVTGFILRPTIAKPNSDGSTPAPKPSVPSHLAHSRYYAAITFNQIVLTSVDGVVAGMLIDVYFELFKEILGHAEDIIDDEKGEERDYRPKGRRGHISRKKSKSVKKADGTFYTEDINAAESDHNAKLISAILTGVNRALPFAGEIGKSKNFILHINTLFRVTHASTTTFAVSLQSLMLLLHVCTNPKFSTIPPITAVSTSKDPIPTTSALLASRFYRTLYASLLDPRLSQSTSSSKHAMYLNLLLKAVKNDPDIQSNTKKAQSSQNLNGKKGKGKVERPSMKLPAPTRPSALTKRYLQTLVSGLGSGGRNEVICAGLYFIGELMGFVPGLTLLLDEVHSAGIQIRETSSAKTSNKLNGARRSKESETEEDQEETSNSNLEGMSKDAPSPNKTSAEVLEGSSSTPPAVTYDPKKRDPQYANAQYSSLWELIPLQSHYHPSVALHARQLLTHSPVTATPDLGLNTLSHFLDRFVYRNAKNKTTNKGTSAMQRSGIESQAKAAIETEVNTDQFRKMNEKDVPVDQIFFHKFFARKHEKDVTKSAKSDKRKKKKSEDSDSDSDIESDEIDVSENEDPDEKEIWKAMKKSIPELEMGDDAEDDLDDDSGEDDVEIEDLSRIDGEEDDGGDNDNEDDKDLSDEELLDFIEDSDDLMSETGSLKGLVTWNGDADSGTGDNSSHEASEEEWGGFGGDDDKEKGKSNEKGKKRGREDDGGKKKKRRTGLGTFASYDDYKDVIENAPEDDI
ncbi:hypothetical protein Clacol_008977 [Clathrus columnatus]|uniref:CCAAT-binding factor domain-containing protein n=1 Tax=Clathrus columnatus TaxID=1419009 RepID=A0AAV5AS43_9AGAM|nr:hypothetical protein Clacol_008977 [Clathrus columnatus]